MKPYKKYKNVGEDWIGLIPSNWEFSKLKFLAKTKISTIDRHEYDTEINVRVCHYPQAYKNEKINSTTELSTGTCTEKELDNFSLKKGQVVITKDSETADDIGVPTFIEEDIQNAVCGYHLAMLETCQDLNSDFLFRYLQSKNVRRFFEANVNGVTRFGLSKSTIENLFVPLPSVNDQIQIAHFLNYQTTIIDKLISKKEKLIDKLKEKRQAIINEAVTKGLDPGTKMKDSGIEWLGEVPDRWKIIKLRYLCDITTGGKDTENREDNGAYPFYVRSQTVERISSYSFDGEAILTAGDGVGVCKVWHYTVGKFDFHQRVYMMSNFKGIMGKYLFFFLRENFIHAVLKLSAKSTVDSLRRPMFLDFTVLLPETITEQQEIISFIDKYEVQSELLIEKEEMNIQKLKEYRQSLISEAVTGKMDVRDWKPKK